MVRKKRVNTTKYEVIQVATRMFLEKGYSNTSIKAIGDELGMSAGHVMFYFPTKDHLLSALVHMLCDYQKEMMKYSIEDGDASLITVCREFMALAIVCEQNEYLKDLYLAAYTHPLTLGIIQQNDCERAQTVYQEFCSDWTKEQFEEAEILVSGIEYAILASVLHDTPIKTRISGALDVIMGIYNVPKEIRMDSINKVMAMDFMEIGNIVSAGFKVYVENVNEHTLEEITKR